MRKSDIRWVRRFVVLLPVALLACTRGDQRAPSETASATRGSDPPADAGPTAEEASPPAPAPDAAAATPPDDTLFRPTVVDGVPVGILRGDRAAGLVGAPLGAGGQAVESFWEPAPSEVSRFLQALAVKLETGPDPRGAAVAARLRAMAAGTPGGPTETYRAQISGYVVAGRRVLHGMFFCDASGLAERWLEAPVGVDDGGDCYFEAWFDVETGEFPHWFINGVG